MTCMITKPNKKSVLISICFLFFAIALIANVALKKNGLRKTDNQNQWKTVAEGPSKTAQPADNSRLQPNFMHKQCKTNISGDSLNETDEEKMLSAVLSLVAGHQGPHELSKEELISLLVDQEASIRDRRQAAWNLARKATKEMLQTFEQFLSLQNTPAYIKAAIVEGLGYSSNKEARELIIEALGNEDDVVVCGAIRGLSVIGDENSISILTKFLSSADSTRGFGTEAAIGLGNIDHPDAYNALIEAYYSAEKYGNENLKYDIIKGLGRRDIAETEEFFQDILDKNTSDPSLRLAAIEALENSQDDTGLFFLNCLNDENPEVRAEAAWALTFAEDWGPYAMDLQAHLANEDNAEVRKRLYQALANQEEIDIDAAAGLIFKEENLGARLAGYDFLARKIGASDNKILREQFDKKAIPELQRIALSEESLNLKLSSVISLKRAGTELSFSALEKIAERCSDHNVLRATGLY